MRVVEDVVTRSPGDVVETTIKIRGRGNSSWLFADKKSYRIKCDEKISVFGEHKDKDWVMIANYFDKTSLRNITAFYMGTLSILDYTPHFHFVELMKNGKYHGQYLFGEKLKINGHRVNVGDDGYLLEIDERAVDEGATYFRVKHLKQPVNIKDPDMTIDSEPYQYIKKFISTADSVLFSDSFSDKSNGWQKYMDMDSFVDWYLINEIARNGDAVLYTSCYMNMKRNGKLKMGPIWDFDVAFGNNTNPNVYPYEGFYIKNSTWYERLFEDPAFVSRVKERFAYFYSKKDQIINEINENARYLRYSVVEDNNKWGYFYTPTFANNDVWGNYYNEVTCFKQWLINRFEWLNSNIANL